MTDTEAESENMDEREWQEIRDLPDAFSRKEPLSTEKEEETQEDLRERFTHLTDEEVVEMSHQGEPLAEDYLLDKYKIHGRIRLFHLLVFVAVVDILSLVTMWLSFIPWVSVLTFALLSLSTAVVIYFLFAYVLKVHKGVPFTRTGRIPV